MYQIFTHLQDCDQQHKSPNAVHHPSIVGDQGFTAASSPDVEFFGVMIIVIVSRVIGQMVLDAGPGRARVAAAVWDAVHKVFTFYVACDTTESMKNVHLIVL